jgi:hypothetical protein
LRALIIESRIVREEPPVPESNGLLAQVGGSGTH